MRWVGVAALLGAAAIFLGAYGSHGLSGRVPEALLFAWRTGVHYHLLHTVVLLALGLYQSAARRSVTLQAALFCLGILLFSFSIYGLVLTDNPDFSRVTPYGGFTFVGAWLSLILLARRATGDRPRDASTHDGSR